MDVLSALRAARLVPVVVLDDAGDADGLGEGRIRTAPFIRAWEGGREYAAAHGLRRVFGLRLCEGFPIYQA